MKFSQHSWFHLSALNCTVFLFGSVSLPLDSSDTFSQSRIWLWMVSYFPGNDGKLRKKTSIYLKTKYLFKKKEACMFSTVCTRYLHVALAAYVPMLWERFTFGHSCNYSVVLSKNVSTWNKKSIWLFFLYIPWGKSSLVLLESFFTSIPERNIWFIPPGHTWTGLLLSCHFIKIQIQQSVHLKQICRRK